MTRERLSVLTMPVSASEANVIANGRHIATLHRVTPDVEWVGFDDQTHTGERWMPTDVPAWSSPGPTHMNEAALLALALAGYDPEAAAKAVGMARHLRTVA